jgi:hypothetical protein
VRNLILVLTVRALLIALLVGIMFAAAAPAFSQDTAQRLKVFEREVSKAARELKVATPVVHVVSLTEALLKGSSPLAAAYIWVPRGYDKNGVPRYVRGLPVQLDIVWSQLMSAGDKRLQCWARHEVTHVVLGHERGARDGREAATHHSMVRIYMEARWRQDSACLIGD